MFYCFLATPLQKSLVDGLLPGRTTVMIGRSDLTLQPPPDWKMGKTQEFVSPDGTSRVWLEEVGNYRGNDRASSLQEVLARLRSSPAEVARIQTWVNQLGALKRPTAYQTLCLRGYAEGLKLWRAGQTQPAIGRWGELVEELRRPASLEGRTEMAAQTFAFQPEELLERQPVGDALWIRPKSGRVAGLLLFSEGEQFYAVAWKGSGPSPTPELLNGFRPSRAVDRQSAQGLTELDQAENYARKHPSDALFFGALGAQWFFVPCLAVSAAFGSKQFRLRYQLAHAAGTLLVLAAGSCLYASYLAVGGRGLLLEIPALVGIWVFGFLASLWLGWRGSREAQLAEDRGRVAATRAAIVTSLGWSLLGMGLLYALSRLNQ